MSSQHWCHHCHHHLGMPVVDVSCIPIPDSFSIWNKKFLSLDWLQNSEQIFYLFFLEISFNLKGLAGLTCKLEWCHKLSTPGQRHVKGENVFLLLNTLCSSPGKFEEWTKVPDIGLRRTWHPFCQQTTLASPSSLPPSSWTSWSPSEDHEPVQDKRNCTCSQAAIWSNLDCHYHGFTSLTFVRTFLL